MSKKEVVKSLRDALLFVGQAQEQAPKNTDLWRMLGNVFDDLDSVIENVEGDFTDSGATTGAKRDVPIYRL